MLLTEFLAGQGTNWEAQQGAAPPGLPLSPVASLPALPPPATACDFAALSALLGQSAAAALTSQLGSVGVAGLLSGALSDQKAQLLTYAAQIDSQIAAVTGQLTVLTDAQTTLGEAQGTLTDLQELTGSATATEIAAACPAAGYLLGLAGGALNKANAGLTGAASMLSVAQEKLSSLQAAQTLTSSLLAELDARLDALPDLLGVFGG